jgi:hypothetical protein
VPHLLGHGEGVPPFGADERAARQIEPRRDNTVRIPDRLLLYRHSIY